MLPHYLVNINVRKQRHIAKTSLALWWPGAQSARDNHLACNISVKQQVIVAAGGETICPPPMALRLAADLRPSADGSAIRTSLVADQLQAASVPVT